MTNKSALEQNIVVWARRAGHTLSPEKIQMTKDYLKKSGLGNSTVTGPIYMAARTVLKNEVPKQYINQAAYLVARTLRTKLDASEGYNILTELGTKAKDAEDNTSDVFSMYSTEILSAYKALSAARQEEKATSSRSVANLVCAKLR